jgi:hypothetical protein
MLGMVTSPRRCSSGWLLSGTASISHPLLERRIVAAFGVFHARLPRQRDGTLAETLEYRILEVAIFGEFNRRLTAIAGIAGARSYSDVSQNDPGGFSR